MSSRHGRPAGPATVHGIRSEATGAVSSVRVGILTVSDAASRGEREDRSGRTIRRWCEERGYDVPLHDVVPDDGDRIAARLVEWADSGRCDAVLTTGGTGFSRRDVTPEATRAVLDRLAPGIAEAFRRAGEDSTPYAVLSRGVAGSRGRVFVANLPGSTGGVEDGLRVLDPLLGHVVELLRGEETVHRVPGGGGKG